MVLESARFVPKRAGKPSAPALVCAQPADLLTSARATWASIARNSVSVEVGRILQRRRDSCTPPTRRPSARSSSQPRPLGEELGVASEVLLVARDLCLVARV